MAWPNYTIRLEKFPRFGAKPASDDYSYKHKLGTELAEQCRLVNALLLLTLYNIPSLSLTVHITRMWCLYLYLKTYLTGVAIHSKAIRKCVYDVVQYICYFRCVMCRTPYLERARQHNHTSHAHKILTSSQKQNLHSAYWVSSGVG